MLFQKVNTLLEDNSTLLMTVAREGDGKLRVTVTPGAGKDTPEELLEPFTAVATPAELDAAEGGFAALLDAEVEARGDLKAAIAEHKAARDELAKAKRAETKKTRQEAASKATQAIQPEGQKSLFDAPEAAKEKAGEGGNAEAAEQPAAAEQ